MLILGIESATPVASAALADETGLLGETLLNVGLTHSEQLLPLIDDLLRQCRRTIRDVEGFGVSAGPGSFTGLRIGMATAKALAQGLSAPPCERPRLAAIPTLEAMAIQLTGQPVCVSPMLYARREQIYAGLYRWRKEGDETCSVVGQRGKKDRLPAGLDSAWVLDCLIQPEAVAPEEWAGRLGGLGQAVYLLGDGAAAYEEVWRRILGQAAVILPPVLGLSRGAFIALAALRILKEQTAGEDMPFYQIKPVYLRGI